MFLPCLVIAEAILLLPCLQLTSWKGPRMAEPRMAELSVLRLPQRVYLVAAGAERKSLEINKSIDVPVHKTVGLGRCPTLWLTMGPFNENHIN